MGFRIRALIATVAACSALLLGGGPAVAGPIAFPADGPGITASVAAPLSRAVAMAEEAAGPMYLGSHGQTDVQTDEEEAAEVRIMLALVGALAALTVLMGALAARRR